MRVTGSASGQTRCLVAAGMARLHEMIGQQLGEDAGDAEVVIGIETDRGPWVLALVGAGYTVYGVNPLQASRYRERHGVSGAKSDGADAHMLTDMVRTDSRQLRAVAGDSAGAEGVKVLARTHKTMIWERTRQVQRLRQQLREYYPAALEACDDLDAPDTLELLGKAPDPARAAKLTHARSARRSSAPAAGTSRTGPPRSSPRCAARSWTSRRRSRPPTPPPCGP
jgi:hypothetical protein